MSDDAVQPMTFPCRFPVKVLGRDAAEFFDNARQIVERHCGEIAADDIRSSSSRNGNFIALTITITATSQQQLDALYRDLSHSEQIMVAL